MNEKADEKHPFKLATSPARSYLNSSFNEMPSSRAREGRPRAKIHPDDLAALGIDDGARIRMGNERGEILIHAEAFACNAAHVIVERCVECRLEGEEGINTLTSAIQAALMAAPLFTTITFDCAGVSLLMALPGRARKKKRDVLPSGSIRAR